MFIACHCLVLYCEVEILEIVIKLANLSGGITQLEIVKIGQPVWWHNTLVVACVGVLHVWCGR